MEDLKTNTKDRELLLSRTLNAPVALVWEAWTNPEHIANWWGPNGFTNTINIMELRPGGRWELVMHGPDGTNYQNNSTFREIVVNKRIVYEHISDPWIMATIKFEDQGDKTLITWHMLFESAEKFQEIIRKHGADEGLKQNVAKLELYLQAIRAKNPR